MKDLKLSRNRAAQLVYTDDSGQAHPNVSVVRAYPISAPDAGVSLLGEDGHELLWIPDVQELEPGSRALLDDALAAREFMPRISRILAVDSYATPSTWSVETDRGRTELILKAEDHIRRLSHTTLLVTDSQGISFLIANSASLDKHSRRLLDRFL